MKLVFFPDALKVETGIILEQRALGVDWGVDSTWCGAAAEWSNREASELLIPRDGRPGRPGRPTEHLGGSTCEAARLVAC